MSSKMTNEIEKKIYPIVNQSLSKSLNKYKAMIAKFMNDRSTALYDTFPATRMLYGQQDADEFYNSLGVKETDIQNIINNTYYGQIPNFNPRAAKSPVTVLGMCCIKYFLSKKDQKNLELSMIYLSFSGNFYPSLHYSSYPHALPADYRFVCDYVVNNELSNKFDLKTTGNVIGAIKNICNTWINTYGDRLIKNPEDEDYVYLIQQLHMRIKSFMQNTAEVYYRCYENKNYLTYESDDMSQDNFRLSENDSTKIDSITQRTMTYITSHDVDYRICKMCADSNIKTEEIKSIIESVVKNTDNIDLVKELVMLITTIYFENSKTKDVRDIEFISFTIKAKPNSKDKNVIRQGEIIEKMLTENSLSYNRRKSRLATKLSYNRAVLTYFTLLINQTNK